MFGHKTVDIVINNAASENKKGYFESAENKQLLRRALDEIGELPLDIQAKLLRVLKVVSL